MRVLRRNANYESPRLKQELLTRSAACARLLIESRFLFRLSLCNIVVDLGFGKGQHIVFLSDYCKQVLGIEISNVCVSTLKNELKRKGISNVSMIRADVHYLPLKGGVVDGILMMQVLEHLRPYNALAEVVRVMKDSGIAVINVPNSPFFEIDRILVSLIDPKASVKEFIRKVRDHHISATNYFHYKRMFERYFQSFDVRVGGHWRPLPVLGGERVAHLITEYGLDKLFVLIACQITAVCKKKE